MSKEIKDVPQSSLLKCNYVKVIMLNDGVYLTGMNNKPKGGFSHQKKLSSTEYADLNTGEVMLYKINQSSEVKKSTWTKRYNTLYLMINYNFKGDSSEVFITLTYGGENAGRMFDYNKAASDFKRFKEVLFYHYPNCECIAIPEPQQSGSWHIHILVKQVTGGSLYIPNEQVTKIWGKGLTITYRISNANNLAKYFIAKTTPPIESDKTLSKSEKKGLLLNCYPRRMRFPWKSKGIVMPEPQIMSGCDAMKLVQGMSLDYSRLIVISDDASGKTLNSILKQEYSLKRFSNSLKNDLNG